MKLLKFLQKYGKMLKMNLSLRYPIVYSFWKPPVWAYLLTKKSLFCNKVYLIHFYVIVRFLISFSKLSIPAPEDGYLCMCNILFSPFFCVLLISLYTFLTTIGERYRAWNLPTIQSTILKVDDRNLFLGCIT